jgi:hypothetical protein
MMASAGISHMVVWVQPEVQLVLASARVSSYSGSWKSAARRELRIKSVARRRSCCRRPDHLFLGEAQGAGMIELVAQLLLVDLLGDAHPRGAVDERERHLDITVKAPDHLEHHQLVEIGVEQAANDRIELESVIVDPLCDVGRDCHDGCPPPAARRDVVISRRLSGEGFPEMDIALRNRIVRRYFIC